MKTLTRLLIAPLSLIALAGTAAAQSLTFDKADYPSSSGSRTIVTADWNRDGWPDVAIGGVDSADVSILLNDGGHRLTPAGTVPVGIGPFDMVTGDFNRDGIPDLAVANADNDTLSILIGGGDGRFTRSTIATRANPRGITTGDFNKDGKPDLAYTAYVGAAVEVLLGDGRGGFTKGWTLSGVTQPQGIAAADFNRDGHLDIAVASVSSAGLVVWTGPAGNYVRKVVAGDSQMNVVATADLNGDGLLDVAAASTSRGRVAIYLGTTTGLAYRRSFTLGTDPRGITIADLNIDGAPDVITANRGTSTVTVLRGDPANRGSFLSPLTFASSNGSRALVSVDFDGDGVVDLVTGNQYTAAASVLSNVTAFLPAAYTFGRLTVPAGANLARYREGLSAGASLGAADFNRDGKLDVVKRVVGTDSVAVALRGGSTVTLAGPPSYAGHVVADFNDDSNADILYFASAPSSTTGTQFATFAGNGKGSFTRSPITAVSGRWFTACVAGDLNQDRDSDLVCVESMDRGGAMYVLPGKGDGTFTVPSMPTGAIGMDPQLGDMNRDGKLDVVLGETGETWLGDGAGGLTPGPVWGLESSPGWRVLLADLNHDGFTDIVSTYNGESIVVTLGSASGFVQPSRQPRFGCECDFSVVVADIDVDGNLDILANSVEGTELAGLMFVLPGHGDGTFAGPDFGWDGVNVFAHASGEMLVADVTADGLPDVVVPGGPEIQVLVNQRNATNRSPVIGGPPVQMTVDHLTWANNFGCIDFPVTASDPDAHGLFISWQVQPEQPGVFLPNEPVGRLTSVTMCADVAGTYDITLTADDGRGGVTSQKVAVITILGATDIVLHTKFATPVGAWSIVSDASAASGARAYNKNLGAPKVITPSTVPTDYIELSFEADPAATYKLWLRLKADSNSWANDSVYVQFSGSATEFGDPAYRIGTTSALAVNLEECSNCGISGWGWEDDGWGAVNRNGVMIRFPAGGVQRLRIQTREDGVSVDQIVLSAAKYVATRPGTAKNDNTILPATP